MQKNHVVVLMGGVSTEHEVSLNSGRMVAGHLSKNKYEVTRVVIDLDGRWIFEDEHPVSVFTAIPNLKALDVDCVFIALHGPFGEDGRIQGMLDVLGIPYTGSGCVASAIAMDKVRCKAVVRELGIPLARHIVVEKAVWSADPDLVTHEVESELGFSCVIKSPCQGSSLGMAIAATEADFRADMDHVLTFDDVALVEEFIPGIELTCGVLDMESEAEPRALPVTQILPVTSSYFDYDAKYIPGATEEITPAEISDELKALVQETAVRVHQAVGCETWSRSDFMVKGNDPVWLEVNTIPGMTQTSLYPQAAAAAGIAYGDLIDVFVEDAIERAARRLNRTQNGDGSSD